MNTKVACLIATYNRPELLLRAYKSVLAQDYGGEVEIFIINDGGESSHLLNSLYNDAFVIDMPTKQGPGACYNEALRHTDAEYICYLGDDDIFYPDHIATLVDALQGDNDTAYTDLLEVFFEDGYKVVRKSLEISRDFDRLKMLEYSHVLGGSIMHKRSLLEKTGPWSTDINCLFDYDMLRRMCLFTDFTHIKKVTGEYWKHIDAHKSDRISKDCRRNTEQYNANLLRIRNRMPANMDGWKIGMVAICIEAEKWTRELINTLLFINAATYWPYQVILSMPKDEMDKHRSKIDEFENVIVGHPATYIESRYICHVPYDEKFAGQEVSWIENALFPLSQEPENSHVAYECPNHPGIYVRRVSHANCHESKTETHQWPLNFDRYLMHADTLFGMRDYAGAIEHYKRCPGNVEWMSRRITASYLKLGDYGNAYTHLVEAQKYPNIDTLRLAHGYCTGTGDTDGANECQRQIDLINSIGTI